MSLRPIERRPRAAKFLRVFGLIVVLVPAGGGTAHAQSTRQPKIPLREGLTVVTAISDTRGDFETVKQVSQVKDSGVTIVFAADLPGGGTISSTRPVSRKDLREALEYRNFFNSEDDRDYPGTTALGPSVAVMEALETKGESPFKCYVRRGRAYRSSSGVLEKVGDETVSILVNGVRTELPVVHAHAELEIAEGEIWILDHPEQPLTLRYRMQRKLPPEYANMPPQVLAQINLDPEELEVVKIEFPADSDKEPLEEALEEEGRAEVYGIYFDFDSDELKPESDAVLQRIANVLGRRAAWNLAIEGHTDNVGGDTYNLELSDRRAAAVKRTLVDRYGIAAARLTTKGFGATKPKASNDTLAGRARNRRVELVRMESAG